MVCAWYMDDSLEDQRLPHKLDPSEDVPLYKLRELSVYHWFFDPATYQQDPYFHRVKEDRGFSFEDQIEISPDRLDDYETKIKSFFDEHIHTDDEVRYVLDGSGYFDVRDSNDRWIRIEVCRGDMIVLPSGIYHRFTLDSKNYIKALRLFVGKPVWTPYSRSSFDGEHPSVRAYKQLVEFNKM